MCTEHVHRPGVLRTAVVEKSVGEWKQAAYASVGGVSGKAAKLNQPQGLVKWGVATCSVAGDTLFHKSGVTETKNKNVMEICGNFQDFQEMK